MNKELIILVDKILSIVNENKLSRVELIKELIENPEYKELQKLFYEESKKNFINLINTKKTNLRITNSIDIKNTNDQSHSFSIEKITNEIYTINIL
jgi:predicted nucleic acid-binding protein